LGEFTNFYRESNGVVKLLKRKAIYSGESIAKHTFKEKLDKFFNPKTNKTYSVSDVRIFKPSGELTRRTRNISVGDTKWSPTPKKPDSRSLEILDYSTGSYSRNITGSETLGSVRQVGQLLPSGQIQLTNSMFTKPAMTFQRVFS
jgi:hypothetical protein